VKNILYLLVIFLISFNYCGSKKGGKKDAVTDAVSEAQDTSETGFDTSEVLNSETDSTTDTSEDSIEEYTEIKSDADLLQEIQQDTKDLPEIKEDIQVQDDVAKSDDGISVDLNFDTADGPDISEEESEIPPEKINAEGKLILPSGMKPAEFEIGNRFATVVPDINGNFIIPVASQGITVTAAVPSDWSDTENIFLGITAIIPKEKSTETKPVFTIDADTTARSLILLNPYFLNPNPFIASKIIAAMQNNPEITLLANYIYANYSGIPHPFDDSGFLDLYVKAVESVNNKLPESLLIESGGLLLSSNPFISAIHLDSNIIQVEAEYDPENPKKIKMDTSPGVPLDTYMTIAKVDPDSDHTIWSASGSSSFKLYTADDIDSQTNDTDIYPEKSKFPLYTKDGSVFGHAVAPAKSLFKYLDIAGLIMDEAQDFLGLGDESDTFVLPDDKEAVYVIRGFTGMLSSGIEKGEFGFGITNFKSEMIKGTAINIMNAVIDTMSIFVDMNEFIKQCTYQIIFNTMNKASSTIDTISSSDESNIAKLRTILVEIGKETASSAAGCVKDYLEDKTGKALFMAFKALVKTLDLLGKVSKAGSLIDRIGGLTGISPAGIFSSPMESMLIRVGDPLSPVIMSVNGVSVAGPGFYPVVVAGESSVTIKGKRFKKISEELPHILINDELGLLKEVIDPAISGTVEDQTISFKLPAGISGRLRVLIAKGNITHVNPAYEIMEVIPEIKNVSPQNVFKKDPNASYQNAISIKNIKISGKGFVSFRHKVRLGSTEVPVNQKMSSSDALYVDAGSLNYGKYDVSIDYGQQNPAGGADAYVRLVGIPVIDSFEPSQPSASKTPFVIKGKNFGEISPDMNNKNLVKVEGSFDDGNTWEEFAVPEKVKTLGGEKDQIAQVVTGFTSTVPEPDKKVKVRITTPEGTSSEKEFTTASDISAPEYSRMINTGKAVSPVQAFSFANGTEQPEGSFESKWHWHECGENKECYIHCVLWNSNGYEPYIDASDWVWNFDGYVTRPPGVIGNEKCPSYTEDLPNTWEGLTAEAIYDSVYLMPDANNQDPSLTDLQDTPLKGPFVMLNGAVTGGGLKVEGISGKPNKISVSLFVADASSDVITLNNVNDVKLEVQIHGKTSCNTGIKIISSKNVVIDYTEIYNCNTGIAIKDSSDIVINQVKIAGYSSAGIDIDGGQRIMITGINSIGIDYSNWENLVVPQGQNNGIYLHGGTSDNIISGRFFGNQKGVLLQDASDNILMPDYVGVYPLQDTVKGNPENDVGIEIDQGSDRNIIRGGTFGGNRIGVYVKGGEDNLVNLNQFGVWLSKWNEETQQNEDVFYGNHEAGIKIEGGNGTGPLRTVIGDNTAQSTTFYFNDLYGIHIYDVEGETFIKSSIFAKENKVCSLMVEKSENIKISGGNYSFNGKNSNGSGICIRESENILLDNNEISGNESDGVKIEKSHLIHFNGSSIMSNKGDGIHIIESSGISVQDASVQLNEKNGVEIEKAPEIFKSESLMGESPQETFAPYQRKSRFDKLNKLPAESGNFGDFLVKKNMENGIFIHDGAGDLQIKRAHIDQNNLAGIRIENGGDNIEIAESVVGAVLENDLESNHNGIEIENSDGHVRIGSPLSGNLVSGNSLHGIHIKNSSNVSIEGNYIGTAVFGDMEVPNNGDGIHIENSWKIQVGGGNLNSANLISGNSGYGIYMETGDEIYGNRIDGNIIGLKFNPVKAIPNKKDGIYIVNSDTVAASVINENFIGGNGMRGIFAMNSGNMILSGNLIGKKDDTGAPNINGLSLYDSRSIMMWGNLIYGNSSLGLEITSGSYANIAAQNTIFKNGSDGINVGKYSLKNTITHNSIHGNTGKGIELMQMGNKGIPAPIIRSIAKSSTGTRSVYGEVDYSVPDGSIVEVFLDTDKEGEAWVGSTTTVNHQFFLFDAVLPQYMTTANEYFSATVTDPEGNTSEFGYYFPNLSFGCDAPDMPLFEVNVFPGDVVTKRGLEIAKTAIGENKTSVLVDGFPDIKDPDACGNYIVYSWYYPSMETANWEIYIMDVAKNQKTRLTTNDYSDIEPAFSSDCLKIVFVSIKNEISKIYTMDFDGDNIHQITSGTDEDRTPHFSLDETKIVFSRKKDKDFALWTINTDESGEQELLNLDGDDLRPRLEPSEDRILFKNCKADVCRIGIYYVENKNYKLFGENICNDIDPEWYPAAFDTSYILLSRKWKDDKMTKNPNLFHVIIMAEDGYPLWRITPKDKEDTESACCLNQ
jgi:parallel beta-helix repeat protein